jgi:hypothetical protein
MKRLVLLLVLLWPSFCGAEETFQRAQVLMGDVPVVLTVDAPSR